MNTDDLQDKRTYASPLRADQANQTRGRILEAFAEQLVDGGLKDFSIDRVAKRASVSTRTVYHHFPNRDDLFDALNRWLDEQVEIEPVLDAKNSDDLLRSLSAAFAIFDEHESVIRAHLMTDLGQAVRQRGRSLRLPVIERIVRQEASNPPAREVRQAAAVIHYLASSEAWRSLQDESGLSGKQAGEAASWAIRCLLAALSVERPEQSGSSEESSNDER